MTFEVTFFGYGAGLVMAGWFAGMVVGYMFRSLGAIRP
jgi:hypothetical protein